MSTQKTKSDSQISTLDDVAVLAPIDEPTVLAGDSRDGMSGAMETITIHSTAEDGGSDAVFVAHNNYAYQIPRDKPFKMPTEVAQILRDAVVTTYKPGPGGAVTERSMPRFAFSAVPA